MINIILYCVPNYTNETIIHSTNKNIDLVSQFIILYKSIKKNWHFDYRISLFTNKNIKFNNYDTERLSKLDIDIYYCDVNDLKFPINLKLKCFTEKLKLNGSHRLLLECDMIALREPEFDLSCDWQAGFANGSLPIKYLDYINKKYNFNINLNYKFIDTPFINYINGKNYKDIFPHFNAGAYLIKEELCEKFVNLVKPSMELSNDINMNPYNHISIQYSASFALMKLSDNWKPFNKGFNYLLKTYPVDKFGKDNITLLHYCGVNVLELLKTHFNEYLI